jgi:DNA-binding beta-propeller fold protein YncE
MLMPAVAVTVTPASISGRPLMKRARLSLAFPVAVTLLAGLGAGARPLPQFEVDRDWPAIPSTMKIGDASSMAVDAQDRVWLLHRPRTLKPEDAGRAAPPVVVFDASGKVVKTWGGEGAGYQWPQREHGIHVDPKGFVWIGGNYCPANAQAANQASDDQLLKFTQDGTFVLQIGKSAKSTGNADRANLHRPADQWVNPRTNELFVADGYGNHRVIVFDAESGRFKRMWGAFGKTPVDDDHCTLAPAQPLTGDGPAQFSIVHAVRVANDGTVYVADRENRRVQAFTSDGTFLKQLIKADTTFARDLALSPDKDQTYLYVGNGDDIQIVDRKALEIIGTIKVPGQIGGGHHLATDSKGNIYIAQTTAGLQKLTFKGLGGT